MRARSIIFGILALVGINLVIPIGTALESWPVIFVGLGMMGVGTFGLTWQHIIKNPRE